jgi:hypothetical protein
MAKQTRGETWPTDISLILRFSQTNAVYVSGSGTVRYSGIRYTIFSVHTCKPTNNQPKS